MGLRFPSGKPRKGQWVTHDRWERPGIVMDYVARKGELHINVDVVNEDGLTGDIVTVKVTELLPLTDKNLIPAKRLKTMDSQWTPLP